MANRRVMSIENTMARVTALFPGADRVIHSSSIKVADEFLRKPALMLAPIFMIVFKRKTGPVMLASKNSELKDF